MIRNILTIVIISIIIMGCLGNETLLKADFLPGYWQARQETSVVKNGFLHNEVITGFYYEFYSNNCGQVYDRDENPIQEIKWALQEGSPDRLFISKVLTSSDGSSTDLYTNEVREILVFDFEDMNMRTFYNYILTDGEDEYHYRYVTYFVKQR